MRETDYAIDRILDKVGVESETPCNVTIDIYGEQFHFNASRDEAPRLIAAFERVLAARRDVRRIQFELEDAKAAAFDGVSIGAGSGIVVDDPDDPGVMHHAAKPETA
jgi:hypothetical protein